MYVSHGWPFCVSNGQQLECIQYRHVHLDAVRAKLVNRLSEDRIPEALTVFEGFFIALCARPVA